MSYSIESLSEEDLVEVARLHCEAFAGYMNTRLGLGYVQAFLRWFLEEETAVTLVAKNAAGKAIGYVLGAPLGYSKAMSRQLLRPAALGVIQRPWLLVNAQFRGAIYSRIRGLWGNSAGHLMPDLPKPTMSLVSIGVSVSMRGAGVGRALICAFEREAQTAGMASVRLSVYPDNQAARIAYERCEWKLIGKSPAAALYYGKTLHEDTQRN